MPVQISIASFGRGHLRPGQADAMATMLLCFVALAVPLVLPRQPADPRRWAS